MLQGKTTVVSSTRVCAFTLELSGPRSAIEIGAGDSQTGSYVFRGQNAAWAYQLESGAYAIRGLAWVNSYDNSIQFTVPFEILAR